MVSSQIRRSFPWTKELPVCVGHFLKVTSIPPGVLKPIHNSGFIFYFKTVKFHSPTLNTKRGSQKWIISKPTVQFLWLIQVITHTGKPLEVRISSPFSPICPGAHGYIPTAPWHHFQSNGLDWDKVTVMVSGKKDGMVPQLNPALKAEQGSSILHTQTSKRLSFQANWIFNNQETTGCL